ncbi:MAG: FliO/MopB family protein [Polyangiales bacterium]
MFSSLALDFLRTLLALGAVCALIWFSLRFLARRGLIAPARAHGASLEVLARLPLEPRKSLYLVRAGKRLLLLATGDGGAPRLLTELDESVLEAETSSVRGPAPHV